MFLAMSRFAVANGMETEISEAFRSRPHRVDTADGFLRMEVWRGADLPNEFHLLTWWRDRSSFETWHRSHAYKEAHVGMPTGLKLVPGSTGIECLDFVAD